MTTNQIQTKLLALVGRQTMIANVALLDIEPGPSIHAEGTLEHREDDDRQPFYVRIRETAGGSNGIGFAAKYVEDVETLTSGMPRIVLK